MVKEPNENIDHLGTLFLECLRNVHLPSPFTMHEKRKLKCVTIFIACILELYMLSNSTGGKDSCKLIQLSSFMSI